MLSSFMVLVPERTPAAYVIYTLLASGRQALFNPIEFVPTTLTN
jgi:hypothetical protein